MSTLRYLLSILFVFLNLFSILEAKHIALSEKANCALRDRHVSKNSEHPNFDLLYLIESDKLAIISHSSESTVGSHLCDIPELVDAWKKVKLGGIDDFSSQPGYIETLKKINKYQDEAAAGSSGTVKYYRVQTDHPDSKILTVDESNGNLIFNNNSRSLNISTTSKAHAEYYAKQKGPGATIIEFEVPKSIDIQMKEAAVPQYKSIQNLLNPDGNAPKIVDPLQPGDPFELPSSWHQIIEQNYVPGSAKVID